MLFDTISSFATEPRASASGPWPELFCNLLARAWIEVRESELDGVVAHVFRPSCHEIAESAPVIREQRSRRFLEAWQIARDSRHEVIGGFLRRAPAIRIAPCSP